LVYHILGLNELLLIVDHNNTILRQETIPL